MAFHAYIGLGLLVFPFQLAKIELFYKIIKYLPRKTAKHVEIELIDSNCGCCQTGNSLTLQKLGNVHYENVFHIDS